MTASSRSGVIAGAIQVANAEESLPVAAVEGKLPRSLSTRCCIVGGGPGGLMLGLLLARAGVDVTVLEKHRDFLRDFRGDTLHPASLTVMHELGLLDDLLELPHDKAPYVQAHSGDTIVAFADFRRLRVPARYIAFMPQWDFLNFVAAQAARYPGFRLVTQAEVTDLIYDGERVAGVKTANPHGLEEVRADLVIGADGRHSTVVKKAGLPLRQLGAAIDVLWFRLPREDGDPPVPLGRFYRGRLFVMYSRSDSWQVGYLVPKGGGLAEVYDRGIDWFRADVAAHTPLPPERAEVIRSWDDVPLLTVMLQRLTKWYREGLLCIGDSAHAMSPVAGVGINMAIMDAVATANALAVPLAGGEEITADMLKRVQRRRAWAVAITQQIQSFFQDTVITPTLRSAGEDVTLPFLKALNRVRPLTHVVGIAIGRGILPEHVDSPATLPQTATAAANGRPPVSTT